MVILEEKFSLTSQSWQNFDLDELSDLVMQKRPIKSHIILLIRVFMQLSKLI